ncbi:hypothetical protein F5Y13DRAFT_38595 [Hypoxylon sp. FL1857]|nr:hypothetical protein F5Y13DRAFT_38595 [Hypoxylon sp. FL1857]
MASESKPLPDLRNGREPQRTSEVDLVPSGVDPALRESDLLHEQVSYLIRQADILATGINELRNEIAEMRRENNTMRTDPATTRSDAQQPPPNPPPAHESRPRPVLPDPPIHDRGGNPSLWRFQMSNKLKFDGGAIGSPEAQFHYVFARLSPLLQHLVLTAIPDGFNPANFSPGMIFEILSRHNA